MKGTIQLEIEHVKYKDFVDFDNLIDKKMVLAPIKEDQDKAVLRFFYERESFRKLVHEETITLVPFKKNTEILLKGTPKSARKVACSVQVDSGEVQNFVLKRPVNVAALALVLVGAAALALLGIFGVPAIVKGINAAKERSAARSEMAAETTPAPPEDASANETAAADNGSEATAAPVVASEKKTENLKIYFTAESAVIRPAEKEKLDALIKMLKGKPILSVEIDGHCADYNSKASQKKVSENRTIAIRQYLKSVLGAGLPDPKTKSYGSTRTVSTSKSDEYLDRRAEITVVYEE